MLAGAGSHPTIVFQSSNQRTLDSGVQVLRSVGGRVVTLDSPDSARTWTRIHRADLLILDLASFAGAESESSTLARLREHATRAGTKLLLLSRARAGRELTLLFSSGPLSNFLAVGEDDSVDPVELVVTADKILNGQIFGEARYLAPDAKFQEYGLCESKERHPLIEEAVAFAEKVGCHTRIADAVGVVLDELLTNALYNAPVDDQGKQRFAHLPRTENVRLEPTEKIRVRLGTDGRRLSLLVADPFGALPATVVESYLAKCFAHGPNQVDQKSGGAGLGLYGVLNLLHHFILNIDAGRRTEAIGLLKVSASFRHYSHQAKSFNVFVGERA